MDCISGVQRFKNTKAAAKARRQQLAAVRANSVPTTSQNNARIQGASIAGSKCQTAQLIESDFPHESTETNFDRTDLLWEEKLITKNLMRRFLEDSLFILSCEFKQMQWPMGQQKPGLKDTYTSSSVLTCLLTIELIVPRNSD
jgi:hypothetical protein